jgi:tRNA(Ile)-lysidine synthetase-like protein
VHSLAQRVLDHIRRQELLKAGDRAGVAVSGGIDSVALLRLLIELRGELGIVLSVVHFNHKLRGAESDADQEFVAELAREHHLEFHCDSDDVAESAREEGVSVEAAAREVRYGFFRYLISEGCDQGLKPRIPKNRPERGPEGALFHVAHDGAAEDRARSRLDKIATGHTLDDQAETVLMRMIRGAGVRGLGAIYPRILVEDGGGEACGEIVRPLLGIRRRELEQYLNELGQPWREDSSNADESLTRNRIRKLVVPLLEREFNPAVAENLAELAEIARGEEDYWENEAAGWMGTAVHWSQPSWARDAANGLVQIGQNPRSGAPHKSGPQWLKPSPLEAHSGTVEAVPFPDSMTRMDNETECSAALSAEPQFRMANAPWLVMNASVSRLWLLSEPAAVQRRLVKAIGEQAGIPLEFKHVEEILAFAAEDGASGRELSLPLGWRLRRKPDEIAFLTPDLRVPEQATNYEYELPVPGQIVVVEAGLRIETQRVPDGTKTGYNSDQLLDADSLRPPLRVRNWRPGDRFWPAHTKSPKKIKELLQERHLAQPERKLWPVVLSGDEVVWLRGFPVPAKLRAKPGREAILILEKPLPTAPKT